MKYPTLLILFYLIISSCSHTNKETIIKGEVIGNLDTDLMYSIPVNGTCNSSICSKISPDSLGQFELKFAIDKPSFICLFQKNISSLNLILEPGNIYNITVSQNDKNNTITVIGGNELLQKEYQNLISPPSIAYLAMNYVGKPLSKSIHQIDSMYQDETSTLNLDHISKKLTNLIQYDRNMFYSTIKAQVCLYKYIDLIRKGDSIEANQVFPLWKNQLDKININDEIFLSSKWGYDHIDNYINYTLHQSGDYNSDIVSQAQKQFAYSTYKLSNAKKYLHDVNLELYSAIFIAKATYQKKFEKELITIYEQFTIDYPDSKYSEHIKTGVDEIIKFHEEAKNAFSPDVKFVSDYQNIKSLNDCFLPFKGKKIYVDIWATFCSPCKQEFKYKSELKELLTTKNVEILYLSQDKDSYDQRWKDMIKYYSLSGNHARVNAKLKADLREKLGRSGIPRYLIVNENGEIINDNAPRPSNLKELEKLL